MGEEKFVTGNDKRGTVAIPVPRQLRKAYLKVILPYLLWSAVAILLSALIWFYSVLGAAQLGNRFYAKILPQVLANSVIVLVLIGGMLVLVLFLIANELARRISGQLYRLERDMEKVKTGAAEHVALRKGDELGRLAQMFNEALDAVRTKSRIGSGQ